MNFPTSRPVGQFNDINGKPLEDGRVWFGQPNLDPIANPITVYWDAAGTQPVTQPVQTIGGYPINGTTRANVFVNSDYSVLVRNRNGFDVFSAAVMPLDDSSANQYFLQAGAGAVVRTAQAKMRETVSVLDFGADSTGATDCSTEVAAAYTYAKSTGGELYFPPGTYLGQFVFNGEAPVRGAGQRRTTLKPSNTSSYCVRLYGVGGDTSLGATLSNLSIVSTAGTGTGLLCGDSAGSGFSNGLVERLEISGFADNLLLNSAIMCTFRAIWSKDGTYGLRTDTENNITTCHFDTCRFTTNDYGIKLEAGIVMKFTNCNAESNAFKNLWLYTSITQGPTRITFDECWFEDLTASSGNRYSVHLDMQSSIAATKAMAILFNRCVITSPSGLVDVRADYAQDVVFDHCAFSVTGGFTSTKFSYATGTNAVRVWLKDCGTIQLAPTAAMYASFPALTTAVAGTFGFFYEFTVSGGKRYYNFEPLAEEGTWIPAVEGATTPGVGTYTARNGYYTKIGNRVFFNCSIDMTAHTGTGDMRISGLPYQSSSLTGSTSYVTIVAENLTFSNTLAARVAGGLSLISLSTFSSGGAISALPMDTSCNLRLTGSYMIDI